MRVVGNFVCSYLLRREGLSQQPSRCISNFCSVFLPSAVSPVQAAARQDQGVVVRSGPEVTCCPANTLKSVPHPLVT